MTDSLPTALFLLLLTAAVVRPGAAQPADDLDARVNDVLEGMTLEQKVGEMTQLTLQAVSSQEGTPDQAHRLDMGRLREVVVDHHVGSILNNYNVAFTAEHWREIITTIQDMATEERPTGIPVMYGIDAVHGHNYMQEGTLFPQSIGMAATWNPELVRRENAITAAETRASGIPWNFSPVLDVGRQPLWSRFFETYGEDVHLATELGRAATEGLQGDNLSAPDRVAATGKHFLGYSQPRSGKDRTPAHLSERELREYFLPPFEAAIDAGVRTIMVNSGAVNDIPVHADATILTDLLREELGFDGVVVTDWADIDKLVDFHRIAATKKEAVRMAVEAGIDMSMTPYSLEFHDLLVELVQEGTIPESRVDESVRRILRLKMELGLFEQPYPEANQMEALDRAAHREASRQAANESITLLKNDGTLPLGEDSNLLVTGPGATSLPALHGSWTYTWQGTNEAAYPDTLDTVLDALQATFGADQVRYHAGDAMTETIDITSAAEAADAVVLCLAERPSAEQPGDIHDLRLPEAQQTLARTLQAAGTPVIVVLLENRPRIVRDIVPGAAAVVTAYQPGPFGGPALADVLTGRVNPSGHLPFTYPAFTGALVPYDHGYPAAPTFRPQWPFGHGLSYTTFDYANLLLSADQLAKDGTLTVSVDVSNTGDRAGKDVVQLYVSDRVASVAPPVKRLCGFRKIGLQPGEMQTVTFELPVQELAFVGRDNERVVEAGEFEVQVDDLTQTLTVRE